MAIFMDFAKSYLYMKTKLTKSQLSRLRESLPPGAINKAATELNLSYSYVWQHLNNPKKSGFYDERIINILKSMSNGNQI